MSYEALLRKTFKSGDFTITDAEAAADGTQTAAAASWLRARSQISRIVQREAADANCCLTAHKEGVMKLAPFVKFREEKFGAVLFETRSEKVYTLSPTGAAVVREVVTGVDAKTVIENLKTKFDDKTGKMEAEATAFIAQLREKGLVTE